jgi:hypothetical protein
MTISGSEAYVVGLAYCGLSKGGVKRKCPNVQLIVDELKKRFPDNHFISYPSGHSRCMF